MPSNMRLSWLIGAVVVVTACSGAAATPSTLPIQTAAPTSAPSEAPVASATSTVTASPVAATADGQIVFEDASGAHRQIYILRADGSDLHRLVASDNDDVKPRLSPDGRTVAFTRYAPDSSNVFVVNVDGTGLREIDTASCVKPCGGDEDVSWSPDGTQLAVTRDLFDAFPPPRPRLHTTSRSG